MKYALLTEGSNEETLLSLLLERGLLIYAKEDLLGQGIFHCRQLESKPQALFLFMQMPFGGEKITIVRTVDKLSDTFKALEELKEKVSGVVDYHTTPEFEMLFICGEGLYPKYKQSGLEPKQFAEKNVVFNKKPYDCSNEWIEDYIGSKNNDEIVKMFAEHDKKRKAAHKDWNSISKLVRK